jgi:uncharacterized RDD family membrane protein YckC
VDYHAGPLEATIVLHTPEGVDVSHPLGGVGSRSAAQLIDLAIQSLAIAAVVAVSYAAGGSDVLVTAFAVSAFVMLFLYDVLFEVYGGGATIGKRRVGLRVIETSGRPVGWRSSAIRNAIRLIEGVACLYVLALLVVLVTERSQRLGDLAAGTVVIRDGKTHGLPAPPSLGTPLGAGALDATGVDDEGLGAIHDFLARRSTLEPLARARVARALADALRPRVVGGFANDDEPERLLEAIAAARRTPRG